MPIRPVLFSGQLVDSIKERVCRAIIIEIESIAIKVKA